MFLDYYNTVPEAERNYYELMVETRPLYLAFDLDRELLAGESELPLPKHILDLFISKFSEFASAKGLEDTCDWCVLDSSIPGKKVSIHLVHRGLLFRCRDHIHKLQLMYDTCSSIYSPIYRYLLFEDARVRKIFHVTIH